MTNKEKLEEILNTNQSLDCPVREVLEKVIIYLIEKEAKRDDEIKIGDVVYWHSKDKHKLQKTKLIREEPNGLFLDSQCNYINPKKAFKTEQQLIESLRGYDE